ncbi:MAG: hypothetical protein IMY74_01420 [Bacteroidetes bacterium]|nr:hypothetical protein [Bacteroidota bacterium]
MKNLFSILFMGILSAGLFNPLSAQDDFNEIYAGYAPGGVGPQLLYELSMDIIDDFFKPAAYDAVSDKIKSSGNISLGYNRFLKDWLKVGITASYVHYTVQKEYTFASVGSVHTVEWRDAFISGLLSADFHYLRKKNISMYSGVSAGICFVRSDILEGDSMIKMEDSNIFAYHLNAIGVRFGHSVGFFLETGFGYKGILNGGLSFKF